MKLSRMAKYAIVFPGVFSCQFQIDRWERQVLPWGGRGSTDTHPASQAYNTGMDLYIFNDFRKKI